MLEYVNYTRERKPVLSLAFYGGLRESNNVRTIPGDQLGELSSLHLKDEYGT